MCKVSSNAGTGSIVGQLYCHNGNGSGWPCVCSAFSWNVLLLFIRSYMQVSVTPPIEDLHLHRDHDGIVGKPNAACLLIAQ